MPEFYILYISLINQLVDLGEKQLFSFWPQTGRNLPLNTRSSLTFFCGDAKVPVDSFSGMPDDVQSFLVDLAFSRGCIRCLTQ